MDLTPVLLQSIIRAPDAYFICYDQICFVAQVVWTDLQRTLHDFRLSALASSLIRNLCTDLYRPTGQRSVSSITK